MSPCKSIKNTERQSKKRAVVMTEVLPIEEYAKQELDTYALPEVCNRVRSMLDSEDSSMDEISKVVVFDPSVSSAIMRMANSAMYNFSRKIDTLSQAVTILGGERIYSMLVSQFTMTTFRELHCDLLDMKRFWTYSFCTAFIAQELAKKEGLSVREQEVIYICGLMHNIGELAVAKRSPKSATLCEKLTSTGIHPWVAQKEQLGFHYAECSEKMMERWGLPETITSLVGKITTQSPQNERASVRLLSIAANCALEMVLTDHFDAEALIKANFDNLEERDLDVINTAKRNAVDRSLCIVDLMDSFVPPKHFTNESET
tara:strand:+ start:5152 stop:6099 length:948 start_codon:yes stop_codon:yes gene_type:complete